MGTTILNAVADIIHIVLSHSLWCFTVCASVRRQHTKYKLRIIGQCGCVCIQYDRQGQYVHL